MVTAEGAGARAGTRTSHLLAPERQGKIVELINQRGSATVAGLVEYLGVTGATIRRDLEVLASRGIIQRARGGAIAPALQSTGPTLAERSQIHRAEKERIGKAAAELVRPGDAIYLDAGSTTLEIFRHLVGRRGVTVITCSTEIPRWASYQDAPTVVLTGGTVIADAGAMAGHAAERTLRELHPDTVFLSAGGVTFDAGITAPNLALAGLKAVAIQAARTLVLVADHNKFGRVTLHTVCPLNAVQRVITDRGVATEYLEGMRSMGIEVTVA